MGRSDGERGKERGGVNGMGRGDEKGEEMKV